MGNYINFISNMKFTTVIVCLAVACATAQYSNGGSATFNGGYSQGGGFGA